MKYIKYYSRIVIYFMVSVLFISYFILDILPILYKFFMNESNLPFEMKRLLKFLNKIIFDIKLYTIFSIITFSIIAYVKSLKNYLILVLIFLCIHFVIIAEIGDFTLFRRLYQFFIMLPLLWIFFDYFAFKNEGYYQKITHSFIYISLVCIIIPGAYFVPFFNGIAGWTVQVNKEKAFSIGGVFLVRNDGKEIVYSRSIVNPINFTSRLNSYSIRNHSDDILKLLEFYELAYKKRFHILKEGKTPNQSILDKLSYPGHNPYGNFDYSKFPLSSIKEIKIAYKYYNWDKTFIKEKIIAKKDWK